MSGDDKSSVTYYIKKCCGNCRWFSGKSWSTTGRCACPVPAWALVTVDSGAEEVHESFDGKDCDAWQIRGAE